MTSILQDRVGQLILCSFRARMMRWTERRDRVARTRRADSRTRREARHMTQKGRSIMTNYSEAAGPRYVDALLEQLCVRSDKPVLRYLHTDVTGGALRRSIFRYARALEALGIGRGSLVALLAPNCPDALAIRYAANFSVPRRCSRLCSRTRSSKGAACQGPAYVAGCVRGNR